MMKRHSRRSPPSKQGGFFLNPFRFGAASAYQAAILALSPRGYWRLGETTGTTAADSSGNGRSGTYTGNGAAIPTLGTTGLVSGDSDKAATFVSQSAVDIPYGSWMNSGVPFSTTFIANCSGFGGAMMGRRNSGADSVQTSWVIRNNGLLLRDVTSAFFDISAISPTPSTGVTYHYLHSYDSAGFLRMYRNGLLIWSKKFFVTPSQPTAGSIQLMANKLSSSVFDNYTSGVADEFAFFPTALTEANAMALATLAGLNGTPWTINNACALAQGVWALRGINSYTGALIDVRRSSDNATRTISVNAGELDTADMLGWSGSDSVYVSKIYEQRGNGHHFVQATNASQPRIVNAGTLHTQNSKPVIDFSGGNWWMEEATTTCLGTTDSYSIISMMLTPFGIGRGIDTFGNGWSIIFHPGGHTVVLTQTGAASFGTTSRTATATWATQACQLRNTSSASILTTIEGLELENLVGRLTTISSSLRTSTKGMTLGLLGNSTGYSGGKFAEAMVFRSTVDHGVLNTIKLDQHSRFGV